MIEYIPTMIDSGSNMWEERSEALMKALFSSMKDKEIVFSIQNIKENKINI